MELIKSILASKQLNKMGGSPKKIYGWSYYGDLVCKELSLTPQGRGRLMAFFKGRQDGHLLLQLSHKLISSSKLPTLEKDRISYFIGSVKRLY